LRLALPNTVAMFGSTLVAVAETGYGDRRPAWSCWASAPLCLG